MERILTGVTELLKILSSVVSQQISEVWGVHADLEKLKGTLEMIAAVTSDAEKKQGESEVVRLWLKRLKDVVYDSHDVLDEFSYDAMHQSEIDGKRNKVRVFFSSSNSLVFRCKMAKNIKNINKRLDDISMEMKKYQLISTPDGNTASDHNISQQNLLISYFVTQSNVQGRDTDKSNIINMLTAPHPSQQENSTVVSIVGMGGIGKTTLAQLVYKDESIIRNFETRAWVCVSDNFDITKILTLIIESVTDAKCDEFSNSTILVSRFQKELNNKKYLIVLHDVWSEDPEDWDTLLSLLIVGAQGSKVLVTTRSTNVASIVGGIFAPYMLQNLPESVCWSIIKTKLAFSSGGEILTSKMTCIGEEIARKCGGSPLAANVLWNLMRLHNTENDWLSIRDHGSLSNTDGTTKIIPILKFF